MNGYVVAGAVLLILLAAALLSRWRTECTIKRLDEMLTDAMEGRFSETNFDESRLSALECRLGRYLAASDLSARNLQEQKDQISALISDISHQTKTPVANLQLYAQLLEEQPLTPQGKDCAKAISVQAEKLQNLIEALVKASRLETGILVLHPQNDELGPVVARAAAQYAPKAWDKEVSLTVVQGEGQAVFDGWRFRTTSSFPRSRFRIPAPASRNRNRLKSLAVSAAPPGRISRMEWASGST